MKPREFIKCECNTCGSSYEVFYDVANDYYMCKSCIDTIEEAEGNEGKHGILEPHDLYNDEF